MKTEMTIAITFEHHDELKAINIEMILDKIRSAVAKLNYDYVDLNEPVLCRIRESREPMPPLI